jgi:Pyruvate/2-oxoacid:ferredoxin oxidoreductase delta subunit/Na+-translocating ferredoxin:NAD+ oxidoreductase RnfG subunit
MKKRLIIIALLMLALPALYFDQSHQSSAAESTVTTTTRAGDLFRINKTVVVDLIANRTDVKLAASSGNVSYYIITSTADHRALGLVYYTPDAAPEWAYGYVSRVGMLVYVDTNGTILALNAYRIAFETYADRITPIWLHSLVGRNVFQPLTIGQDVEGVTSATVTSRAIVDGIREAGRRVVDDYGASASRSKQKPSGFLSSVAYTWAIIGLRSLAETVAMIGLYASAIIAYKWASRRMRYIVMGAAIVFIGFYMGRMISIVDLTGLPLAGLPPLLSNTYWYALFGLALATSIIWGRLYCGYLCPFGAFTQILHSLSPIKIKIPMRIQKRLVFAKYFVLVAVVAGVALGDFWVTGFEPFQTFFFLTGQWWMWVIAGAAVLASVPAERFFCRYFCPAGAVLSLVAGLRIIEIRRWPECKQCLVCQRTCPTGAIVGSKVSSLECMNCRECEMNYLDHKVCPHYSIDRLNSKMSVAQQLGHLEPSRARS